MPNLALMPVCYLRSLSNQYEEQSKRQAEVYVFCFHNYKRNGDGLNPLDLKRWEFYVLPTNILDEKIPNQEIIDLKNVTALGDFTASFGELKDVIEHCLDGETPVV